MSQANELPNASITARAPRYEPPIPATTTTSHFARRVFATACTSSRNWQPQPQKEPQDSIRKEQLDSTKETKDNEIISSEANEKMKEEKDIIMKEEKEKKYDQNDILQEALDQKSISIIDFANELDYILTSIKSTWENYRDGYTKYCVEEIRPKVNELLNYPCINSNREKVILAMLPS